MVHVVIDLSWSETEAVKVVLAPSISDAVDTIDLVDVEIVKVDLTLVDVDTALFVMVNLKNTM